jgi:Tfp pilus tip-associated adhesin PilY1
MKKILFGLAVYFFAAGVFLEQESFAVSLSSSTNSQYACQPPFLSQAAKPNIHFVLDITGSMKSHPYQDSDQTYTPSDPYWGYFKENKYYKYDLVTGTSETNNYWKEQDSTTCTNTDNIGTWNCVSGRLLNYVTSNKYDIMRKILTGGRVWASSPTGVSVLEHDSGSSQNNSLDNESTTSCNYGATAAGKLTISSPTQGTVTGTLISSSNSKKVTVQISGSQATFTITSNHTYNTLLATGAQITTSGFASGNNGTWTIDSMTNKIITITTNTGIVAQTNKSNVKIDYSAIGVPCKILTSTEDKTMKITANNTIVRTDSGSFLADGWVSGMSFDTYKFASSNNNKTGLVINSISSDGKTITISGTSLTTATTPITATLTQRLTDAWIRVETSPALITGILQSLYTAPGSTDNKADIEVSFFDDNGGVSYYSSLGGTNYSTVKNQPFNNYLTMINGKASSGGTNTGPAMIEAEKFFKQVTSGVSSGNQPPSGSTQLIANGNGASDPYYDLTSSGTSVATPCRKSFVILISDGEWNSGADPVGPAYNMHRRDEILPATTPKTYHDLRTETALTGIQSVTTYTVYAFGSTNIGRNALITTAIFGGFDDLDNNGLPYPFTSGPSSTYSTTPNLTAATLTGTPPTTAGTITYSDSKAVAGTVKYFLDDSSKGYTFPLNVCNPGVYYMPECAEWDKTETGLPYNYFEATDGGALATAMINAVNDILARTSSSTAASILGNNDNAGATLVQAVFYPEKQFDGSYKASWIGEVQGFWYYLDPKLQGVTIREDSVSDLTLKLTEDKIAEFNFDGTYTKVYLYADSDGNGAADNYTVPPTNPDKTIDLENVKTLWRAGKSLWTRPATDRTIHTNDPRVTSVTGYRTLFTDSSASVFQPYLDVASGSAADVINYTLGDDISTSYRQRKIQVGTSASSVWKLGDVINSTPKIISNVRLNTYNLPAPGGYNDSTYNKYINSKDYSVRGTAYVGANDGMIHAFKTGRNFTGNTQGIVAEIKNADGTPITDDSLGKELWAFIPKNALPYLQYRMLPTYQHMYYVDGTPLVLDASIGITDAYNLDGSVIFTPPATATADYSSATEYPVNSVVKYLGETYQCVKGGTGAPNLGISPPNTAYWIKLDYNHVDDHLYHKYPRRTTLDYSTGQLDYSTATPGKGTSWRTVLIGYMGLGGAANTTMALTPVGTGITVVATSKKFTRTSGSFTSDGFAAGTIFTATGFTNSGNNGTFKVSAISANNLEMTFITPTTNPLVNETSSATATLKQITVKTPIMDPVATTNGFGYSSVFALDVTNPISESATDYPKLLWEFSDPRLGFTTVTPTVVRVKDLDDTSAIPRNGRWVVILASGPTGPITSSTLSFDGTSDKPLTIFVIDLKTGKLLKTFNNMASGAAYNSVNSSVHTQVAAMPSNAFAGSLSGSSIDVDKYSSSLSGAYSDDAVYIGYARGEPESAPTSWNKGGVLRLLTYNQYSPDLWSVSKAVDDIGPVTSAVTRIQDKTNHNLWLYFGTGRYFVKGDDPSNVQTLYGVKDLCFGSTGTTDTFSGSFGTPCTTTITVGSSGTTGASSTIGSTGNLLVNQTTSVTTVASSDNGWFINLAGASSSTYPKRVVTDPLSSTNGIITFTTFTPSLDVCSYGGTTSLWAIKYDTGGSGIAGLKGVVLIQLSTGAFQQVDVGTAFSQNLNRETTQFTGGSSKDPPPPFNNSNHTPSKRILHIQER